MSKIMAQRPQFHVQSSRGVDRATWLGVTAGFGLVIASIAFGGKLTSFFDLESFVIVFGGTLGATLVTFPLDDFKKTISIMRLAFYPDNYSTRQRLRKLIDLAKNARVNGRLSLQGELNREPDPFMRKCIELIIDGFGPDEMRRIAQIEIALQAERHNKGVGIFQTMGAVAPAMGLIGTLIGLVRMLENLNTPETMGPAMAIALLTTFYGAILAHLVFLPLSGKLQTRSREEILLKEMTLEGAISILQGTNPRIIEERLLSYLPPEKRASQFN